MSVDARLSVNEVSAVRIGLAGPEQILSWSSGEVTSTDTVNYRTGRPVPGGLFCERIFGPERDLACGCGKYRGVRHRGRACEQCGVEVGDARGRRRRMGHIDLAAPVVHLWFFKLRPSALGHLLGLKARDLERVVYHQAHLVVESAAEGLPELSVLSDDELREAREKHGEAFTARAGAEAVESSLEKIDLRALAADLRGQLRVLEKKGPAPAEKLRRLAARLRTVEGLLRSGNRPEWMVLRRLPVIPPDLRPIVRLDSGNYASSDLNDLYRRILQRNARLKKLLALQAPEVILRNEKRLLQQAVDALFDNERSDRPVLGSGKRPLKSLAEALGGKEGRFRANLLGKRVDYSARSVIVVGPELKLHQCGLPRVIALELFQPFVARRLLETGAAATLHRARRLIERGGEEVAAALEHVVRGHPVLLNRAPTLHRMGIQAFEPVLVEGKAIRLHPLVCKAFNADFDGDQMAVHLPLSVEARREAAALMTPAHNVFSPANGQPIVAPSKDMVLGCYYLTMASQGLTPLEKVPVFASPAEALLAHASGQLATHEVVQVRLPQGREVVREGGPVPGGRVTTTVGRLVFNDALPAGLPFYDLALTAGNLSRIIADCRQRLGLDETIALLERVKELGFREATRSGLSIGMDDLAVSAGKEAVLARTRGAVARVRQAFERGDLDEKERAERSVGLWLEATRQVRQGLMRALAEDVREGRANPLHVMAASGARGSPEQLGQLAGMRGLMARPSGEVMESPITSSFREGLSAPEYFSSTHGARKGLVDTAMKTAEAGYLTRRLVDAVQGVLVSTHDCGSKRGLLKRGEALVGRVSLEALSDPVSDEVIVEAGGLIGPEQARRLAAAGLEAKMRGPLTCAAERGLCRLCYGADRATGRLVDLGQAVGVIAAQSIGEPATQLVMRTFHHGGAAGGPDITRGLPRLEELFEAVKPARAAVLAEVAGVVRVGEPTELRRGRRVVHVRPDGGGPERAHVLPKGKEVAVETGRRVAKGDPLTAGPASPHDLLRLFGPEKTAEWLLGEVRSAYREQGVVIDDKHVEVVLARMLAWERVLTAGDSDLLPGALVERRATRGRRAARGAVTEPVLLGLRKAALQAEGFLSAAAFQETTRVLAGAALAGAVDRLAGLKENVLLGHLVPAGTGFRGAEEAPATGA